MLLEKRRGRVLRGIVIEYVATATPVASESLAAKYRLGVSPATVRNDIARLEAEGLIERAHPSAGAVPSDKGYRYYVESLAEDWAPLPEECLRIRHQFHQVEPKPEGWVQLAATILADLVHNLALVTWPKSSHPRFNRLELVSLQDTLALLVLVLSQGRVKRQLLALREPRSQGDLNLAADFLNLAFSGLGAGEVMALTLPLNPLAEQVRQEVGALMQSEVDWALEEPHLEGFSLILSQPEFASGAKAARVAAALEKGVLWGFLLQALEGEGVQVVIGAETGEETLQGCSLVLSRYGFLDHLLGALAVVGPTRMDYERTISSVRYVSRVMSELIHEL